MTQVQQSPLQPPLESFQVTPNCASSPPAKPTHVSTPRTSVEDENHLENDLDSNEIPCPPYREGFRITAFRHQPPEPFGLGYDTDTPIEQPGWQNLSQLDYCLSRSPSEGRTDSDLRKNMVITSTIRTGQQRGAQIVVVDQTMVAKIYDPLYYSALNEYGTQDDVVRDADADYCREAAAFEELQKSPEALTVTPAYYGTWTTDVETRVRRSSRKNEKHTRTVRFILMERLHGTCMVDVDPYSLREEVRSMILKKVIVAETLIRDAGVKHRDVCPRNIIILGSGYDDPDTTVGDIQFEVKILDFNVATVITYPHFVDRMYLGSLKVRKKKWPSKLLSPIMTHSGHMMEFSTAGWCSNDDMEAEKWLWYQFHNDDRYVPVVWDPNDPYIYPVYQKLPTVQRETESSSDSGISVTSHLEDGSECDNGSSTRVAKLDEDPPMKTDSDIKLERPEPEADAEEDEGCAMALHV
jgi:hypothetical protein